MPDLRLALSSLQCPVQLPPSTRDRIEDSTWSTQCKPKQGSFSIATQSPILQTVKRPFQSNWKLFKKAPYSFLRRPVSGCGGPRTKLLRHFRVFFNFALDNNLLYFKNGTKSPPPPSPPPVQSCSPLTAYVCISCATANKIGIEEMHGNCGRNFCQDESRR